SFVVCAVAWIKDKAISDSDYVVYKNDANLLTPDPPTLSLDGVRYSLEATYPSNSKLVFDNPKLADGEVLFTVNGDVPTDGLSSTKIFKATGGDGKVSFDPTKPYTLNVTAESVLIRAKFHDKKKGLDSPVVDFKVLVKQKLSSPSASLPTNTMIRPNEKLELSLSNAAIKQLGADGKVPISRVTYKSGMDDIAKFPGVKTVKLEGDIPQENVDYVSYNVNETTQSYGLPTIFYLFGDDKTKVATEGTLYKYAQRRVLTTTKVIKDDKGVSTIEKTVTITYTNPESIPLTGTPLQKLKVNVVALSNVESCSDSDVVTFYYTIRDFVAKPTAFPETDPNKPAAINLGDRIALSSETSDALIFYTLDGSEPKADYNTATKAWVPQGTTKLYSVVDAIEMTSNEQLLFTIRAMAVSKDFSLENSPSVLFRYQPPAPVQAIFTSPIQGPVVLNQGVSLQCATEGARIFYRIFTSKPDLKNPENIPKINKDQIFDPKVPIVITKPTWIVSVGEKNGVISGATLNEYTVAPQLREPYASIKTGSVLYKGTRIRLNAGGNLAYTIDGSDPKAAIAAIQAPPAADGKETKKPEVLYGDSVVIDADYGKSVTVKAFTYGEGKSPSNVATFNYTVCDKDAYLVAAPPTEAVVTAGDNITLTTGVSNGLIFYSLSSATPTVTNRFNDEDN
ncbi:MAG: chitobiase/beta-hexosaminidase C-terminal domain-containing protein, partial [Oscillospiraceae bacterium]